MTENYLKENWLIDARGWLVRGVLLLVAAAALIGAYYGLCWQFGQALAESFVPGAENAAQNAVLSTVLSPRNSLSYSILAKVQQGRGLPEIQGNALKNNESAVRYEPNDYRYWLDLGRTRNQTGDTVNGEAALRRAVELAPNYAYPRWTLGNMLLREDKRAEALNEFKIVAANHTSLRQQVFYTVWESSNGDADELRRLFGDTPTVRAALAMFYAAKDLPNESTRMWQTLTPEEKAEDRGVGETAMRVNYEKANFHAAQYFARDLDFEAAEIGKITNGGFESEIGKSQTAIFDWHVEQMKNLDTALDLRQPREGKRTLRLTFNGFSEPMLQAAQQLVAVESGARYRLTFALRTSDLKSAGTPLIEITDLKTLKTLGASQPFSVGSSDWQNVSVEFTAPIDEQAAVLLRTSRSFCGANCPIVGVVWYDDFKLERIGAKK